MANSKESKADRQRRLSKKLERISVKETLPEWDDEETTDVIDLALRRMERDHERSQEALSSVITEVSEEGEKLLKEARRVRSLSPPPFEPPKEAAGD